MYMLYPRDRQPSIRSDRAECSAPLTQLAGWINRTTCSITDDDQLMKCSHPQTDLGALSHDSPSRLLRRARFRAASQLATSDLATFARERRSLYIPSGRASNRERLARCGPDAGKPVTGTLPAFLQ